MTAHLDPRRHAYRDDLADARLEGRVEARRFVEGEPASVARAVLDIHEAPQDAALATQLLRGAEVDIFERRGRHAWVQARGDGYVGWCEADGLAEAAPARDHVVAVARTFVYGPPELRSVPLATLSMGTRLRVDGFVENRGNRYWRLDDGTHVFAAHLRPLDDHDLDFVAVAEALVGTPYLWGGASALGIDCSGLVQLALAMCGRPAPRDSDMQEAELGAVVDAGAAGFAYRRGDLVFWPGHVGIMADAERLLDANGVAMSTTIGRHADKATGIEAKYGAPRTVRRIVAGDPPG